MFDHKRAARKPFSLFSSMRRLTRNPKQRKKSKNNETNDEITESIH
jgi:hypothetical protein